MWPCAIGSREETATGACYIHGKGRRWFLCRVILTGAGFFAGKGLPFVGVPTIRPAVSPLLGIIRPPWSTICALSKNAGPEGTAWLRGQSGRDPFHIWGPRPSAEIGPAFPLPLGPGMTCSPWIAFGPKPFRQSSDAITRLLRRQRWSMWSARGTGFGL